MSLTPKTVPRKLPIDAVESAANTFTAGTINLPNKKGEEFFDVDRVEIVCPAPTPNGANTNAFVDVQLIKANETPTAMLQASDDNLLYFCRVRATYGANSELVLVNRLEVSPRHEGYLEPVANDKLYWAIKQTNGAAAAAARGKLLGSVDSMSKTQLTTILLNELE